MLQGLRIFCQMFEIPNSSLKNWVVTKPEEPWKARKTFPRTNTPQKPQICSQFVQIPNRLLKKSVSPSPKLQIFSSTNWKNRAKQLWQCFSHDSRTCRNQMGTLQSPGLQWTNQQLTEDWELQLQFKRPFCHPGLTTLGIPEPWDPIASCPGPWTSEKVLLVAFWKPSFCSSQMVYLT